MVDIPRCIISNEQIPKDVGVFRQVLNEYVSERDALRRKWSLEGNDKIQGELGGLYASTIPLRLDWFATFNAMYWTLVPDAETLLHIIRNLMKFKAMGQNATPLQVIKQDSYSYIFVPLTLEGMNIYRREAPSYELVPYEDPYNNFPKFSLPLHPYPAILHAHKAFERFGALRLSDAHLQMYNNIERIWALWGELEAYTPVPSASTASASSSVIRNEPESSVSRATSHENRKASRQARHSAPYSRPSGPDSFSVDDFVKELFGTANPRRPTTIDKSQGGQPLLPHPN
ncbi:hypothetical protein QCA50_006451 [Cerrena zonata]|uniref:Uncharacterized protein n=1 Tax=Cerrena zonata TaxID=2478898 RepID=A0AAW0GBH8_9APHY